MYLTSCLKSELEQRTLSCGASFMYLIIVLENTTTDLVKGPKQTRVLFRWAGMGVGVA
jgi:hypothetical protein